MTILIWVQHHHIKKILYTTSIATSNMVTRVSGGSSMARRATLSKYGVTKRKNNTVGRAARKQDNSVGRARKQDTRSTRAFAGNTAGGNKWRSESRTYDRPSDPRIKTSTHQSSKSGHIRKMDIDQRDGTRIKATHVQTKTGYKSHANAEQSDGLKYSYKYNVNQSDKNKVVKKRAGSKVTKVMKKTKQGSVGAVKGSGIKTIKFKSIKSRAGPKLGLLSKRRKPKTVTKMGPRGTVKSVTKPRSRGRTGPRKQLY